MTKKLMKIFALVMACMMVLFVSVAAYADEVPAEEKTTEEEVLEQEEEVEVEVEAEAETEEEPDEEDLVEIDDDWGYISPEVIEQHTPEMTQEFIHADDPNWPPKEETEATPEPVAETTPEVQETVEESVKDEAPAVEETPAEVTEEKNEAEATEETEVTEDTTETTETAETEETVEESAEQASKVTVKVTASMRSENLMHLKAEIDDPEGNEYEYQWQVSVDGGENYEDVEDQTEDFMDVELDEENASNLWRVRVHK